MINQYSRYVDSALLNVTVNKKTRKVIVPSPAQAYNITYRTYLVAEYDTLDGLADQFYGSATLWWKIADANPEILDWHTLTPNMSIRIPVTA